METAIILSRHLPHLPRSGAIEIAIADLKVRRGWRVVKLSPQKMRICAALACSFGNGIELTTADLVDVLYDDREDGGPLGARIAAYKQADQLSKILLVLGIFIRLRYGRFGFRCVSSAPAKSRKRKRASEPLRGPAGAPSAREAQNA